MIKDKTEKKKVNAPSDENNTNQKKGSDEEKSEKNKGKGQRNEVNRLQ